MTAVREDTGVLRNEHRDIRDLLPEPGGERRSQPMCQPATTGLPALAFFSVGLATPAGGRRSRHA